MNPRVPITVVVPVYDAEATIPELVRQLGLVLSAVDEVVFVDDGSRDGSWPIIERLVAEHSSWQALQLGRNSGQHAALLAGIRAASRPIIVTMDDDLQHRPADISALVGGLADGVDLVYGVSAHEEHGAVRSLLSRCVKRTIRAALHVEHAERTGAFRCFRAYLRDAFKDVDDRWVSVDVLLSWGTDRVTAVPVQMDPRSAGSSTYTFGRLVRHTLNMVTGYSVAPLRVVAYAGIVLGLLGLGGLADALVRATFGGSGLPWPLFIASLASTIGAVQMLAIALLGEYLGRVHLRTMREPSYFVRRAIGGDR